MKTKNNRKTTGVIVAAVAAAAVSAGIVSMLRKQAPPSATPKSAATKPAPEAVASEPAASVQKAPQLVAVQPAAPLATARTTQQQPKQNTAELIAPHGATDPETAIRDARLEISNLEVRNVGGIVILRGESDRETAVRAEKAVHDAGFARVANLIQQKAVSDDEAIRRNAERQLAQTRALDGCRFAVTCEKGILKVNATVQSDLQEDATRLVLRQVQGTRTVQTTFARF